jgi:hypothetical protein
MSINACRVIDLPKVTDQRGNLTFIEGGRHVPFGIKRVFYLYDVPGAVDRGGHALKICHQFLIAVSGSFDVFLDDGTDRRRVHLSRPCCGLCIPPMVWREMGGFSAGSVCLVLASEFYSAQDYYRDYAEFLRVIGQQPS